MRRIIVVAIVILMMFCRDAKSQPYYCVNLQKTFLTRTIPCQEKTVKLNIYITQNDAITRQELVNSFIGVYNEVVHVINVNGWRFCNRCAFSDINEAIEITIGHGMNMRLKKTLRIKSYIGSCEGFVKYRGGCLSTYFSKVLKKTEQCLSQKYYLRR